MCHRSNEKGFWKMFCLLFLCLRSSSFLWRVNFFFQLSNVVDRSVYLNICLVVKMLLSTFFRVLSALVMGWLFAWTGPFLFFGRSVQFYQLVEVITSKFSWLMILFTLVFFRLCISFEIFSLFFSRILFLISQLNLDFILSLGGLFSLSIWESSLFFYCPDSLLIN